MKIYEFDIDDTLEVSRRPINIVSVDRLKSQGHIVGLNGLIVAIATPANLDFFTLGRGQFLSWRGSRGLRAASNLSTSVA